MPVRGQNLKIRLTEATCGLIKHLNEVSSSKFIVNRAVLQFKIDKNEDIWLIKATSIRSCSSMPLSLEPQIRLPETVNRKKVSVRPVCIQKTVLCRNCGLAVESDKICEISYKMIIKAEEDVLIPQLIKRIHTNLGQDEYEKYTANPLFYNKVTLVCDSCFLGYSQDFHRIQSFSGLGTQPLDPSKLAKRRENTLKGKTRTRPSTAGAKRSSVSTSDLTLPKLSLIHI